MASFQTASTAAGNHGSQRSVVPSDGKTGALVPATAAITRITKVESGEALLEAIVSFFDERKGQIKREHIYTGAQVQVNLN